MDLALILAANGLWIGLNYAVLAATFGMIFRSSRIFHFAHGSLYAVAAYALLTADRWPVPPGIRLPIAIAFAAVAGGLAGLAIYRWIYVRLDRTLSGTLLVVVASLGISLVMENSLAIGFGSGAYGLTYSLPVNPVDLGTVRLQPTQVWGIPLIVLTLIALWLFYDHSRPGLWARASGSNPVLVGSLGFSPQAAVGAVYAVASAGLAVPALLIGGTSGIYPTMGATPTLFAILAVIFGGTTSFWGWAAGGLMLGLLTNLAAMVVPAAWTQAIAFAAVTIIVTAFPRGLLGGQAARYL